MDVLKRLSAHSQDFSDSRLLLWVVICFLNICFLRFLSHLIHILRTRQLPKVVLKSQSMMESANSATRWYTVSTVLYCLPGHSFSSPTTSLLLFHPIYLSCCGCRFLFLPSFFLLPLLFSVGHSAAGFMSFSPLILTAACEDRDVHEGDSFLHLDTCWI